MTVSHAHARIEGWVFHAQYHQIGLSPRIVSTVNVLTGRLRTTSSLSLSVVQDLSSNGLLINGIHRIPIPEVTINGRQIGSRSFVLRPDDKVQFPGTSSKITLTCRCTLLWVANDEPFSTTNTTTSVTVRSLSVKMILALLLSSLRPTTPSTARSVNTKYTT
jgi:hypothetical protein